MEGYQWATWEAGVPCLRSVQSWAVLPKWSWQVSTLSLQLPHGPPPSPLLLSESEHPSVPVEADLPVSNAGSTCARNSALAMMPSGIFSWRPQELPLVCRAQHTGHSQSRAVWPCSVGCLPAGTFSVLLHLLC